MNNELNDSTSTSTAVTLFIRELVIDPDKGPTIEDTPTSILSSSSGSSSLIVDNNNNTNPNNNNNKTSTTCSSASTSESSACSINYLPIPKSSSGHSNASSSSTTSSSSSSSSSTRSSSSKSSASSSSSKTSSSRRRKHRKNKSSNGKQQVQNQLPAAKNIFILNAFVNGFVQLKLCADKIDYAYIVEIYWSNDTRSYVKRTYDDFVDFNKRFLSEFVESESSSSSDTKTNPASTPSKSGSRSPLSWSPNTRKKFNGNNTLTATVKTNEFKKDVKFFNFATNSHVILPTLPG